MGALAISQLLKCIDSANFIFSYRLDFNVNFNVIVLFIL